MLNNPTAKILKFIDENQPCTFDDVEKYIGKTYEESLHFQYVNRLHFITRFTDVTFILTPKGESALDEYKNLKRAEILSYIAIALSILALLKPSNIGFIELLIQLLQLLTK